jgi:hypothetical protein
MKPRQRSSRADRRRGSELYSAPQIDQIRVKLRAYYRAEKETEVLYGFTWKHLAERIFVYVEVGMDDDTLRQFAEGQVSRGRIRRPAPKNLKAIVDFLTHPDINALSPEELKEPDTPYRFARQLMEFLRPDEHSDLVMPPPALAGTYRAVRRSDKEISDVQLTVTISGDGHLVRMTEMAEIFVNPDVSDPADWSPHERKRHFKKRSESRGWGIVTPEDNLLGFMKRVSQYGANHYYATMGGIPDFADQSPVERLALLEYDYPYFEIDSGDKKQWFEEISRQVVLYNLRHFVRVHEDDSKNEELE